VTEQLLRANLRTIGDELMNHDDDDLEDELHEAYGDDDDRVLQDGEKIRVRFDMLDAMQRSVYEDSANHRPGWRVPSSVSDQDAAVARSFAGYVKHLQDGYRSPVPTRTSKPTTRPLTLQDAQAAADSAREERDEWLRNAYKRKPGVRLPHGHAFGDQPNGT
jgi:hypothetical protein